MVFDEASPTINNYDAIVVEVVSSCHFESPSLPNGLTQPFVLFHTASSSETNLKHSLPETLNPGVRRCQSIFDGIIKVVER